MTKARCFALVIFLAIGTAEARDWDSKIEAACPAVAKEEARLLAARPSPKEPATVRRPALRKQLLQMATLDQDAREVFLSAMATGDLREDHPAHLHMR